MNKKNIISNIGVFIFALFISLATPFIVTVDLFSKTTHYVTSVFPYPFVLEPFVLLAFVVALLLNVSFWLYLIAKTIIFTIILIFFTKRFPGVWKLLSAGLVMLILAHVTLYTYSFSVEDISNSRVDADMQEDYIKYVRGNVIIGSSIDDVEEVLKKRDIDYFITLFEKNDLDKGRKYTEKGVSVTSDGQYQDINNYEPVEKVTVNTGLGILSPRVSGDLLRSNSGSNAQLPYVIFKDGKVILLTDTRENVYDY